MPDDLNNPQLTFAESEIARYIPSNTTAPEVQFIIDATQLSRQSYRIERGSDGQIRVIGGDANGAMYGGLDIAEALRLGNLDALDSREHTPFVERRGIKFNIPLDARTPSYSDAGDAAQANIGEMWSLEFWHEFLDEMARDRFNVLTLWNLHPFPSIVKVPEYPDVALDDVTRSTAKFDYAEMSLRGINMVRPETLANLQTLKTISIDDKIEFWRAVMQYAADRGVAVYLFTWNIFVFGAEGKYGITPEQDNLTTIDYFRASVRETLLTYPLLAGFGITAGEQMDRKRTGEFSAENWLKSTYGQAIADVKKLQPDRSIRLIHRFHEANFDDIKKTWQDFPETMDFSYKYSVAHMYSAPRPPFAAATLQQLPPDQRTWLTVRNDDIYSFCWGDPRFAREYIYGMPGPEQLAGFCMGPDGTIWGRENLSREPDSPRQLVIKKQQLSFLLWGRLSYGHL